MEKNYFPTFKFHILEVQEEPKEVYTMTGMETLTYSDTLMQRIGL